MTKKNLLIIELSEFSVDLLTQAVSLHALPHLAKILQFKKSSYKTNDRYNSGYLTPYSQWTSVHLGVSSRKHNRKQPGDLPTPLPDSTLKSCWQTLGEHKISTGLWGVLNATQNPCEHNTFFVEYLNKRTLIPGFKQKWAFLKTAYQLKCTLPILKEILRFKKRTQTHYITWLDYINTLFFCKAKQKYQPQFSILFLDSLAYNQTYHWTGDDKALSAELSDNITMLDKILGLLITQFPNDSIIVHNALSQIQASYEAPDAFSGNTTQHTGRLIAMGTVYSQDIHFPNHIFNHEFNHYIYHYFLPEHYKLKSEYIEDEAIRDYAIS